MPRAYICEIMLFMKSGKDVMRLETVFERLFMLLSKKSMTDKERVEVVRQFVELEKVRKQIIEGLFRKSGKKVSARERILMYLKSNVGRKVSGRELAQVGSISEFARRIRELRHEHGGWQVSTGMNRADLRPDEYVLENLQQVPVYERMNVKVWVAVLRRDKFTCQKCGWSKDDPQTNNRKFLELHHKNPVRAKGKADPDNLITLCNVCHDALEAEVGSSHRDVS